MTNTHLLSTWDAIRRGGNPTHQHTGKVLPGGGHVLQELETGELGLYFANSNRRGVPTDVRYKNTSLELTQAYKQKDNQQCA